MSAPSYDPGVTGIGEREADTSVSATQNRGEGDEETLGGPRTWMRWARERRESIRRRPGAYRMYRVVLGVIGAAIVVGGLALVPLPGPGWVIVFLGLALLATEFTWAARVEKFARDQVRAWTQWLGRQPIPVRVLVGILTFALVLALFYGLFALTGVPGWIPDQWVPDLPGLD